VGQVQASLGVSERRACQVLGQHRSTQRKAPHRPDDEAALTADVIELATTYGRYGYRRITALLHAAGWAVNVKRVARIWRQEGLKVPPKQPKRGRLWRNDGSCLRLRASWPDHVWSYDFVEARTHDGRKFRMLCLIDEFTREALAIRVKRKLNALDVLETLADVMISRGRPDYIRSDNGPDSLPKPCAAGLPMSAHRPPISNPAVPGKMAIAKASTASFATNCSMGRFSRPCVRLRFWLKPGGSTTTRSGRTVR
jgi:putative transposase